MSVEYDAYKVRMGEQELGTQLELSLMQILTDFGETIDPQGYDDGDYDLAMYRLASLFQTTLGLNK